MWCRSASVVRVVDVVEGRHSEGDAQACSACEEGGAASETVLLDGEGGATPLRRAAPPPQGEDFQEGRRASDGVAVIETGEDVTTAEPIADQVTGLPDGVDVLGMVLGGCDEMATARRAEASVGPDGSGLSSEVGAEAAGASKENSSDLPEGRSEEEAELAVEDSGVATDGAKAFSEGVLGRDSAAEADQTVNDPAEGASVEGFPDGHDIQAARLVSRPYATTLGEGE